MKISYKFMQGASRYNRKSLGIKAFLCPPYFYSINRYSRYILCVKSSFTPLRKTKSYPTFANLDKIAEYFNATPTQLFGTSKEIELEKSVLESNEYSDKVSEILKLLNTSSISYILMDST